MENEYESLRDSNIERNKKFLKEIGLETNVIRSEAASSAASSASNNTVKVKRKRRLPAGAGAEQVVSSRRSMRIATLPAPSYKVRSSAEYGADL